MSWLFYGLVRSSFQNILIGWLPALLRDPKRRAGDILRHENWCSCLGFAAPEVFNRRRLGIDAAHPRSKDVPGSIETTLDSVGERSGFTPPELGFLRYRVKGHGCSTSGTEHTMSKATNCGRPPFPCAVKYFIREAVRCCVRLSEQRPRSFQPPPKGSIHP